MNTLSIFIYAADVLPKFAAVLAATGGLIMVGMLGYNMIAGIHNSESYNGNKMTYHGYILAPILAFILACSASLIPSKSTFLAIAASEVGEQIIKTPEVSNVLKDTLSLVQKKLTDALAEEKAAEKKETK